MSSGLISMTMTFTLASRLMIMECMKTAHSINSVSLRVG